MKNFPEPPKNIKNNKELLRTWEKNIKKLKALKNKGYTKDQIKKGNTKKGVRFSDVFVENHFHEV